MKIFYDSTIFSRQTFGGISRYFVELINHMPDYVEPVLGFRASDNVYLELLKEPRAHLSLHHVPDHKKLCRFINRRFDARIMKKGAYDILHPTDYNDFFESRNSRPCIITVHDMIHEVLRDKSLPKSKATEQIERNIRRADHIIAISHATKKDILECYGMDESRITVIHHGYSPAPSVTDMKKPIEGSYILFVGERGGYKNFATFFEAFKILASRYKDLNLVCTGRPFKSAEKRMIAEAGLIGRVTHRMFDNDEMHAAYAGAECFVFPSRYEGFGMPILEAFAAGCPTAVSRASCLPEVAGEGAAYFNPDSAEDMAETIGRVISDSEYRTSLKEAATRRLKNFSWDKTSRLTAETYKSLL